MRPSPPRALAVLLATLSLGACSEKRTVGGQPLPQPEKQYPGGAEGLRSLWMDIVVAAQRDEREKVHDLMASMIMTDDDLAAVFGPARAAYLKPRYLPMVSRLVNIGAMELVAQITDRKYDDVDVFPLDPASRDPAERATLEAVGGHFQVYGVRVRKKGETRGLRYDFFVYRDGRWVTGNQIARYLVVAAPDGGTGPGAAPPAPPPASPKR